MARTPKPWFWAARGAYAATVNGKQIRLGTNARKAQAELNRILAHNSCPAVPGGDPRSLL